MSKFKLKTTHRPAGDQPAAISALVKGLKAGERHQTLLGVTGSGKTFTVANVIEAVQRPTLVIAHNKTLAAQLAQEYRDFFPDAAVHYFVSYYDYYQPEAYMPTSDTYIGKEAMVNDEIDKLRHAATAALLTRKDVIIVASVSCIYGLGAPEEYRKNIFRFAPGTRIDRAKLSRKLVELQFSRTTADLTRGTFRLRGDNWEIMPPDRETIYTFELKGGVIQRIYEVMPAEGFRPGKTPTVDEVFVAPAKHFITPPADRIRAVKQIREELVGQLTKFEVEKKYLEAERLERRTKADLAMIREVGYCNGIENYSRHLSGRTAGEPPSTLLDYFPRRKPEEHSGGSLPETAASLQAGATMRSFGLDTPDFLTIIDESHVTVPQIGGMFEGDASRKRTLVEYGFRLPSAIDNRPLTFKEFNERVGQIIYTSATPAEYERKQSAQIVEQIIRPTGLVDPAVTIRPAKGQIDDLIPRIVERVARNERVLVTTLTKKMAEDLTAYLNNLQPTTNNQQQQKDVANSRRPSSVVSRRLLVTYLHSDVKTLDRIRILTDLRKGKVEVLVGVNLLREGLDLPEVSLVAILDADKEGFLRSETSLVQTIGRAARNIRGEVVMYADVITGSIRRAVRETDRRRKVQLAYNKEHGITPTTVIKAIRDILPDIKGAAKVELAVAPRSKAALEALIKEKEAEMRQAAGELDFEVAAILRDEIKELKKRLVASGKEKKK
ncbi:MAG: excinuclease ABC subunit UvrB [bacterium]|nr:excinuclease ABC subunit UvrB [bacterium]